VAPRHGHRPREEGPQFGVHQPVHLERRQGHVRQSPRGDHDDGAADEHKIVAHAAYGEHVCAVPDGLGF
jgi:hypothetical protein